MRLIHYLLFLPLTFLGAYYLKRKLILLFPRLKQKKWTIGYYLFLLIILALSVCLLNGFAIVFLYAILFYVCFDLIFFLFRKLHLQGLVSFLEKIYQKGLTCFLLSIVVVILGFFIMHHPVVVELSYQIDKPLAEDLQIAMLSDLHLGTGTNESDLQYIYDLIDSRKVDLFVLVGDIFDEQTKDSLRQAFLDVFRNLKTTYGIFYVEGNHDLFEPEEMDLLHDANIYPLHDEVLLIDNRFYLVGRSDPASEEQAPFSFLTKQVNSQLPIIFLTHRPREQKEAVEAHFDLQLSGHTHAGQLFPLGLFLPYGSRQMDTFYTYVSSGYGAWGIPIRTSGRSEIVFITLQGNK